ncbi:SRPBCC family protein [Streptomyces sp. M19]
MISTASVLIKAPLTTVWRLHTDVDNWSSWIPEITPPRRRRRGRCGRVVLRLVTAGHAGHLHGQDRHAPELHRVGAPVNGIDGVHLFTFKPVRAASSPPPRSPGRDRPSTPTSPATRAPSTRAWRNGSTG